MSWWCWHCFYNLWHCLSSSFVNWVWDWYINHHGVLPNLWTSAYHSMYLWYQPRVKVWSWRWCKRLQGIIHDAHYFTSSNFYPSIYRWRHSNDWSKHQLVAFISSTQAIGSIYGTRQPIIHLGNRHIIADWEGERASERWCIDNESGCEQ